jgi:hypothetical protein
MLQFYFFIISFFSLYFMMSTFYGQQEFLRNDFSRGLLATSRRILVQFRHTPHPHPHLSPLPLLSLSPPLPLHPQPLKAYCQSPYGKIPVPPFYIVDILHCRHFILSTFYIVDIFFRSTFDFRHFFVDIILSTFYRRHLTTFPR